MRCLSKTITGDFSITVNKRKDGEIDDFTELVNGARSGSYWGKRSAIEGLISNNSAAVIPSLYELNGMSLQEYGIPALFKFIKSPGVNAAILEQLNSKRQQAVTTVLQEGSSVNDFAIPTDKITFLLNEKNEVISNAVWIYLKENKNESTRETLMMLKGSNEPSIVKNATTILESKVK